MVLRILVTGAGGFLGRRLTRALGARPESALTLVDRVAIDHPGAMAGDLTDPAFVDHLAAQRFDSIFHLAASLTLEAEQDPAAAYATNVEPLRRLIERSPGSRIVFTSSIAVFGGALPDRVDDTIRAAPATTYGAHKAINELLLADASRRGRIDGRVLRLPILLTRPGAPTRAVSDRVAAILREPLAGRDTTCPLAPETRLPVASAGAVAAALVALHDLPAAALPPSRAMNLPSLTVRVADMIAAVERRGASGRVTGRVTLAPEPALQAIVDGWPKQFTSEIATRLGLHADADLDTLIEDHLRG
jgi:nucleoside-diphosphate-sugar epimerase